MKLKSAIQNLILWHSLMRKLQNNLTRERGSNTHFNILIESSNFSPTTQFISLMNDNFIWHKRNKLFYHWTKSQRKVHFFVYWISHQLKDLFQSQFSDVNLVNKIASDCIYLMDFQMHFKWSFTSRIFILICEREFSVKGSVFLDGFYQFSNLGPIDQPVTDNCQ